MDFRTKLANLWNKPFNWYYLGQFLGEPKPQRISHLRGRAYSSFTENLVIAFTENPLSLPFTTIILTRSLDPKIANKAIRTPLRNLQGSFF